MFSKVSYLDDKTRIKHKPWVSEVGQEGISFCKLKLSGDCLLECVSYRSKKFLDVVARNLPSVSSSLLVQLYEKTPELRLEILTALGKISSKETGKVLSELLKIASRDSALSKDVQIAKLIAIESGRHAFFDSFTSGHGENVERKRKAIPDALKLNFSITAVEQLGKIRLVCKYLLDKHYACLTSVNANSNPPPLFRKPNNKAAFFVNGIHRNTGKKLLDGNVISSKSASILMDRLWEKFRFVFID